MKLRYRGMALWPVMVILTFFARNFNASWNRLGFPCFFMLWSRFFVGTTSPCEVLIGDPSKKGRRVVEMVIDRVAFDTSYEWIVSTYLNAHLVENNLSVHLMGITIDKKNFWLYLKGSTTHCKMCWSSPCNNFYLHLKYVYFNASRPLWWRG